MHHQLRTRNQRAQHCMRNRFKFSATAMSFAVSLVIVATCAIVGNFASERQLDNTAPVEAHRYIAKTPTTPAVEPKKSTESALAAYIARRWQVTLDTAHRVVGLAHESAESHGLDPLLVLAVVARESSFQHNGNAGPLVAAVPDSAVNPAVAHGLMQVAGRWHPEKMPVDEAGNMRVTTEAENLRIGSQILSEYLARDKGNVTRALQRYNGNLEDEEQRFATYVLRVRAQLAKVAGPV